MLGSSDTAPRQKSQQPYRIACGDGCKSPVDSAAAMHTVPDDELGDVAPLRFGQEKH